MPIIIILVSSGLMASFEDWVDRESVSFDVN
jgi:hypothetical protein